MRLVLLRIILWTVFRTLIICFAACKHFIIFWLSVGAIKLHRSTITTKKNIDCILNINLNKRKWMKWKRIRRVSNIILENEIWKIWKLLWCVEIGIGHLYICIFFLLFLIINATLGKRGFMWQLCLWLKHARGSIKWRKQEFFRFFSTSRLFAINQGALHALVEWQKGHSILIINMCIRHIHLTNKLVFWSKLTNDVDATWCFPHFFLLLHHLIH